MAYFPFFVNAENLHGVVIGGGNVALEKIERLLDFGADLTLIAKDVCPEIKKYEGRLEIIEREYRSDDLFSADYVIAATNLTSLNEQIYADAKQLKKLINVVDVPEKCDFIFPSVMKKGRLIIGVSSSGAGPQVAIRLRKQIEEMVPDNIEEILDYLAEERIRAKKEIPDPIERRKYLIELSDKLLG